MKNKKMIALQISEELYKKILSDSIKKEVSLSSFIRSILLDYYKREDK